MKINVGTIYELTGKGYEILVDVPTRSIVLAHFFEGNFVSEAAPVSGTEVTLVGV